MGTSKAYIIMWRVKGEPTQRAIFFDSPTYDDAKDFAQSLAETGENIMDVVVYETADHWRILIHRLGENNIVQERGPVIAGPTDRKEAA